jgi:hypothetical protein
MTPSLRDLGDPQEIKKTLYFHNTIVLYFSWSRHLRSDTASLKIGTCIVALRAFSFVHYNGEPGGSKEALDGTRLQESFSTNTMPFGTGFPYHFASLRSTRL